MKTAGAHAGVTEEEPLEATALPEIGTMTVEALKKELDGRGVDYGSEARKPELQEVLRAARSAEVTAEVDEPEVVDEVEIVAEGDEIREAEALAEAEAGDTGLAAVVRETEEKALAIREAAPALIPSAAEFTAMREMAATIANTQMVPMAYRGKPDDVIAAILTGREMGLGPMQSLRDIYVVDGKPSLSAMLLLAQLRKGGIQILESVTTRERAWLRARRADTGEVCEVEWTYEEASKIVSRGKSLVAKDNWQNYPEDMLFARCVGRLARRLGPDLIGSVVPYASEELEDWDDFEGGRYQQRQEMPVARKNPDWNLPANWTELTERLTYHLGAEETPIWMRQAVQAAHGVDSIQALSQADRRLALQRFSGVLFDLDETEGPELAFHPDHRKIVRKAFARCFEGHALEGPEWRLSGDGDERPARGSAAESDPEEPAEAVSDAEAADAESSAALTAEQQAEIDELPFG